MAICRLKRVAADHRGDIRDRLPKAPEQKNGKRVACIGAGPSSLTVANDLLPLGYDVTIYEQHAEPGGLMRINIPSFRLPNSVLDEECGYIIDMGAHMRYGTKVSSLKAVRDEGYDEISVGYNPENVVAERLYLKFGFEPTGMAASPSGTSATGTRTRSRSPRPSPRWRRRTSPSSRRPSRSGCCTASSKGATRRRDDRV